MKKIFKLNPSLHANIWGGNKLREYGKVSEADRIGESWELSFVPGAPATLDCGASTVDAFPKEAWGKRAQSFDFFPVLTKFIDAKEKLSVQVHPDDAYALANEGQYGKSEMWYVVDADEGAGLYMGLSRPTELSELSEKIHDGSVEELLSFKKVKSGDVFFIPAGTIHAIGGGVLIYEIQQNSTLTYRLYDYMRRDKDGNLRELHVEKALKVLTPDVYSHTTESDSTPDGGKLIGRCDYFTTREYALNGASASLLVNDESFLMITAVKGGGVLKYTENGKEITVNISRGDTYFAPATSEPFSLTVSGEITFISVTV